MCNNYTQYNEKIIEYLKENKINIDNIFKSNPRCDNVIDNHSGFNHKKYSKSRGGRNLHHLLMNEQSEYF